MRASARARQYRYRLLAAPELLAERYAWAPPVPGRRARARRAAHRRARLHGVPDREPHAVGSHLPRVRRALERVPGRCGVRGGGGPLPLPHGEEPGRHVDRGGEEAGPRCAHARGARLARPPPASVAGPSARAVAGAGVLRRRVPVANVGSTVRYAVGAVLATVTGRRAAGRDTRPRVDPELRRAAAHRHRQCGRARGVRRWSR
jgi:hypothetical protein